jgi:cardiolipin synthase
MVDLQKATWLTLGAVYVAVIIRAILLERREPYARAAWLLLLVAMPGIGTVLYLLFGEPWVSPTFRRRRREAFELLLPYAPPPGREQPSIAARNAFRTCEAASRWPASGGNIGHVAPGADEAIAAIVADIDGAARTVHLSFYIWLTDHNGTRVVEAVCRAARRGIACRIVADAIGSRALIRSSAWKQMADAGAQLCASLPVPFGLGFLKGHRTDLRNHRKIIVVDGDITWCGSQNCADPAFLPKRRYAPWVDILIRYEGPVARQAELIFASAWMTETGEDLRPILAADPPAPRPGGFPAIAVGTGPLSPHSTMTNIFAAVLAAAQHRVVITTPYFAPDPPLLDAIIAAARRGVQLTIIFPRRNDSRVTGAISRAYYPVLANAGARIYEFRGGLLHAKTLVADEALALVGSANMDRRSLDLNFENNVLFESPALALEVGKHQQRWLADSTEIAHGHISARSLPRRFVDNLLTTAAPLF